VFIGVRRDKNDLSRRINERVRRMIEAGLEDEVKSLLAEDRPLSTAARQSLGYAEIIAHLSGGPKLAETIELIKINTRQFAKAQRTWFKRFRATEWIDVSADANVTEVTDALMAARRDLWSS
jgi:tRNA dimethylallyltransferase